MANARSGATYRLTVEYDGTRYHGWQVQQNARSVAGELLAALRDAGAAVVELGGSGRTDAGVHALAQVAHLRLAEPVADLEGLRRAVNDRLPKDIHLLAVSPAGFRFHARHEASRRAYVYQISRRRTAFAKPYVWWVREELDLQRMREGAARCLGRHDFRQFCQQPEKQESTLVEVEAVEIAEAGDLVLVRIVASHFLWKMVRRLVGTWVRLGSGEITLADLDRLLAGESLPPAKGAPAEWTAPPSGLFLERVLYPGEPQELPPIAAVTPVAAAPRSSPAPGPPGLRSRPRAAPGRPRFPGPRVRRG